MSRLLELLKWQMCTWAPVDAGQADHFLIRFERAARLDDAGEADVREHRHLVLGSQFMDAEVLLAAEVGRVPGQKTDADAAFLQALFDQLEDLVFLLGRGQLLGPVVEQEAFLEEVVRAFGLELVNGGDAGHRPAHRGAVVDRPAFLGDALVMDGNRHGPGFQLEVGGDAVAGLHAGPGQLLTVRMQIDAAGRDYQALGVDDLFALERCRGHGHDLAVLDADMADRVEARFGVDHPAVGEHQVVHGFLGRKGGREHE